MGLIPDVYERNQVNCGGCIENDCNVCVMTDPADLDFDEIVDGGDLSRLPGAWG